MQEKASLEKKTDKLRGISEQLRGYYYQSKELYDRSYSNYLLNKNHLKKVLFHSLF